MDLTTLIEDVYQPSSIEVERRNRIKISIAAYSYEVYNDSIMSDGDYDKLALIINTSVKTGNNILDNFFSTEYSSDTGQWIHKHPDKEGLDKLYNRHYKRKKKR